MKNILERLEKKHPYGKHGIIHDLFVCEVTYYKYKSGKILPPAKKARKLIDIAKACGIKTSYDEIYEVLNAG